MNKLHLLGAVSVWLLTICAVTNTQAGTITFTATGTVDFISEDPFGGNGFPSLPTEFSIGDTFTLTYIFESSTPDSHAGSSVGLYSGAVISATAIVGSYTASATGGNISVYNDDPSATDLYNVNAFPVVGASVQGFVSQSTFLNLKDTSETAHSSDALLLSPPDPANYNLSSLTLNFNNNSTGATAFVRASLESIIVGVGSAYDYDYDYDINKNGEINAGDLILLQRKILDLSP